MWVTSKSCFLKLNFYSHTFLIKCFVAFCYKCGNTTGSNVRNFGKKKIFKLNYVKVCALKKLTVIC